MLKQLHFKPIWGLAAAGALTVAGCAVNPVTGEKELSIVSAAQEVQLGEQNYHPQIQSQGGRYHVDPDLQLYINDIGQKLARVSDRPGLPYKFTVLNSSVPNAWALPGGKIAINRGLLLYLEDESQLAAVLAHEIVHAAARHSAQQMTKSQLLGGTLAVLGTATQGSGYEGAVSEFGQIGASAILARYGRDDELESDKYGMQYMSRAGYDPYGAVELQETFVKLSQGRQSDPISALFASHPPSQARVTANREHAKSLSGGQRYRDRYQRAIAQLKKDEPAYKAAEEAIKLLNAKDSASALKQLDRAVAIQPDEAEFWELRGYVWEMQKNYNNAAKSYGTAIAKNPDYFKPHALRGLVRFELGQHREAEQDLLRSYQILPTQTTAYYLGELAFQRNDYATAQKYFQQVANGSGELANKARSRMAEMAPTSQ